VLLEEVTSKIIGAAMEVHRTLGPGFIESVYRNALCHELNVRNLSFECEREIQVRYKNQLVGKHRLDLLIEHCVIVEQKATASIVDAHLAQALSYMKATNIGLPLIVNFGTASLTWKRLAKTRN